MSIKNYKNVLAFFNSNVLDSDKRYSLEYVINLVKEARNDYVKLIQIIAYLNLSDVTLEKAAKTFGGMNYDEEEGLFDLNFDVICATIRKDKRNKLIVDKNIDVYTFDGVYAFSLDVNDDFSILLEGNIK